MNIRDIKPGKKYKFANGTVVIAEGFKRHLNQGEGVVFVRLCDGPAWIAMASELSEYDEVEEKAKELAVLFYDQMSHGSVGREDHWHGTTEHDQRAWRRVARHVLGVK